MVYQSQGSMCEVEDMEGEAERQIYGTLVKVLVSFPFKTETEGGRHSKRFRLSDSDGNSQHLLLA